MRRNEKFRKNARLIEFLGFPQSSGGLCCVGLKPLEAQAPYMTAWLQVTLLLCLGDRLLDGLEQNV